MAYVTNQKYQCGRTPRRGGGGIPLEYVPEYSSCFLYEGDSSTDRFNSALNSWRLRFDLLSRLKRIRGIHSVVNSGISRLQGIFCLSRQNTA
ncbi:hypothetical protein CDAR_271781 [Caerostris darwini]|uniref:Uncharacterized protein n=1 Tax=Caerostris darwini TaxID=1538125 RepID=A0AAV4T107_9ARAC|nr:hypothetical protein CDAR_271781 [Caerostris darwini]